MELNNVNNKSSDIGSFDESNILVHTPNIVKCDKLVDGFDPLFVRGKMSGDTSQQTHTTTANPAKSKCGGGRPRGSHSKKQYNIDEFETEIHNAAKQKFDKAQLQAQQQITGHPPPLPPMYVPLQPLQQSIVVSPANPNHVNLNNLIAPNTDNLMGSIPPNANNISVPVSIPGYNGNSSGNVNENLNPPNTTDTAVSNGAPQFDYYDGSNNFRNVDFQEIKARGAPYECPFCGGTTFEIWADWKQHWYKWHNTQYFADAKLRQIKNEHSVTQYPPNSTNMHFPHNAQHTESVLFQIQPCTHSTTLPIPLPHHHSSTSADVTNNRYKEIEMDKIDRNDGRTDELNESENNKEEMDEQSRKRKRIDGASEEEFPNSQGQVLPCGRCLPNKKRKIHS